MRGAALKKLGHALLGAAFTSVTDAKGADATKKTRVVLCALSAKHVVSMWFCLWLGSGSLRSGPNHQQIRIHLSERREDF